MIGERTDPRARQEAKTLYAVFHDDFGYLGADGASGTFDVSNVEMFLSFEDALLARRAAEWTAARILPFSLDADLKDKVERLGRDMGEMP